MAIKAPTTVDIVWTHELVFEGKSGHASMVLEWIRRNDGEVDAQFREYLFSKGSITERETEASEEHGL